MRHGLKEDQFRRYEDAIAKVVNHWPTPSRFKPEGSVRSPETLRARLRDAMLSFYKYRWSSGIDYNAFANIFPHSQVCVVENEVVVSQRGQKPTLTDSTEATPTSLAVVSNDEEVLTSIFVLHHNGVLTNPTKLSTSLNPFAYIDKRDVAVRELNPGLYLIM